MTGAHDPGLPVEQFIQALTSQLDRVQATMALKAKAGLPLTFAVKDLSLDLRTHVEMVDSVIRLRPAAPGEQDSSVLHIALTTITAPMIEENTRTLATAPGGEPSLREVLGSSMTAEEQRRLEWVGVQSVAQLRRLHEQTGEAVIEHVADIPVNRLRLALERASQPYVSQVLPEAAGQGSTDTADTMLRIRGTNLMQDGPPEVSLDGAPVPVIRASAQELLVAPPALSNSGTLVVQTAPGMVGSHTFSLSAPDPAEQVGADVR